MLPTGWHAYVDPHGKAYYHNPITQITTYELPSNVEGSLGNNNNSDNLDDGGWTEYTDETTLKKYYVHRVTKQSVWEIPEAYRVYKARLEAAKAFKEDSQPEKSIAVATEEQEDDVIVPEEEEDIGDTLSTEEKIQRFKVMLNQKKIASKAKWHEVVKSIENTVEFGWLSLGAKKQAFAESQTQRIKTEKLAQRQAVKKRREEFLQLMAGCKEINASTQWHQVRDLIGSDSRYEAIPDDADRREIFDEFLYDLARTEREFKKKKREEERLKLWNVLFSMCPPDVQRALSAREPALVVCAIEPKLFSIKSSSQKWTKELEDCVMSATSNSMKPEEARYSFEDFMDLYHKVCKDRCRKLEEQLVLELNAQVNTGVVKHTTRWRDYVAECKESPDFASTTLASLLESGLDTADRICRDVFESVLDNRANEFYKTKKDVEKLLKKHGDDFIFQKDTTFEEFLEVVGGPVDDAISKDYKTIFEEIKEAALARAAEDHARLQRQMTDFVDLLTEYYYRSDHVGTTWDTAQEQLRSRSAFKRLSHDSALRQKVFESYMAKLNAKMKECSSITIEADASAHSESESDDDRSHKRRKKRHKKEKKRKHKRSRRHRSSSASSSVESGEISG